MAVGMCWLVRQILTGGCNSSKTYKAITDVAFFTNQRNRKKREKRKNEMKKER